MKRTAFDDSRDQRIANETGAHQALLCTAHGCPNRWSSEGRGGRLCHPHASTDPHLWPQVTQEQLDAETDKAMAAMNPAPQQHVRRDPQRMRAELGRLAQLIRSRQRDPKQWARDLQAREERGERLGDVQREAWRAALGVHGEATETVTSEEALWA